MINASEADFVAALTRQRIALWSEGDKIRYRAPEGALPDQLRAQIASRREGLLAWLKSRGDGIEATGPLSFAQTAHWLHEQTATPSAVAHVAFCVRLRGLLDEQALAKAFATLVARHPILRTTYDCREGGLIQRVQAVACAGFTRVVIEDEARLAAAMDTAYREPFRLDREPMLRGHLFSLGTDDNVLLIVVHHIAADAWSLWLLVAQLRDIYAAIRAKAEPLLAAVGASYFDYVEYQRGLLDGPRGKVLQEYWRKELQGAPHVLDLPPDYRRPPIARHKGASHVFSPDPELVRAVSEFARTHLVTPATVLLSAWAATLWRYSGQSDLIVGCPAVGREAARFSQVVGDFVNLLPVRARFDEKTTFAQAVQEIREAIHRALAHQEYPFARIVDDARVARDSSRHPLVQTVFVMQKPQQGTGLIGAADGASVPFADLTATPVPIAQQEGRFDMTLDVLDQGERWHCTLKFDRDVFSCSTAEQIAARFVALLGGGISVPERALGDIPLLGPDETRALAVFNATQSAFPYDATIHGLVDQQAALDPRRIAVTRHDQSLTIGELNRYANRLARRLRNLGVRAGVRVGICLDRSIDLVVAMLGVLKSGGAYVPLDPEYPLQRLEFMIDDAGVPVVVTTSTYADRMSAGAIIVALDTDRTVLESESDADVESNITAAGEAYVMYTSGSTGKPKGAVVTHRAIQRLVWDQALVPMESSDVVAQMANTSFDAATFEIWAPLVHGARIEILDRHTSLSPKTLSKAIKAAGITTAFITTPLFNQIALAEPSAFSTMRHLLFGGEVANMQAVRAVLNTAPPKRLIHVYGPTETTTFASWHRVTEVPENATTIPIGRPLANTQLHVLDAKRRILPIGIRGELYIGGPGVARGYVNRPELTRERFLADPFATPSRDEPEPLLYKTGDIVRRLNDGSIEFLGRNDDQVKIRGFRVEVGEIEAALLKNPAVEQAVVIAVTDEISKWLIAYVVARRDSGITGDLLREYARRVLPAFMVPATFVVVPELPLNENGKVDRARLPRPGQTESARERKAPPSTRRELAIADAWKEVLRVDEIGLDDNFFDVGGDSIRMVQLHSRVQQIAGREVPIPELFNHATLRSLAAWLDGSAASDDLERDEQLHLGHQRLRQRLRQRRGQNGDGQ
jgi:amino acid adenylation domain-containing protein